MIEAVKSTVANSVLSRGSVDQSSTLNSYASNPEKLQVASVAPYVSPTVRVDVNTKIAILEFRDTLSGEVLAQIPSEQALRSYRQREAIEDVQLAEQLSRNADTQKGTAPIRTNATVAESTPTPQPSQDATSTSTGFSGTSSADATSVQVDV